jgi:GNAT superfamily N-acetyltransferase
VLADSTKGVYYVAEGDGTVIGQVMITYEWSDWRNGNLWWLQSVYVKLKFRGQGVFRALFQHVMQLAKQDQAVPGLRLYMHSENERARHCYENLGMNQTHYQVFEMNFSQSALIG